MKAGWLALMWCGAALAAGGTGLVWPEHQFLPALTTPAPMLDEIDVSSATGPEIDLFASLEGIVNRTRPRIACVSSADGEGAFTWLNLHNLAGATTNGLGCVLKYRSEIAGLVVTDPSQPDTLNLATTMAGVNQELICDPSLLAQLTNAPYNLPVLDDLRGRFTTKYQVYGYLYTNYWPRCTHRLIAGMETGLDGNLRDYLVAAGCATVWLDPGNPQDAAQLGLFLAAMTPVNGVYLGWWPSEANGLTWIAQYGIPVIASDFYRNGSVFGGVARTINVPPIPPPPPLQNKVYVSLILSDGDNAQYMEHVMKMDWENPARGALPIGWTTDPLVSQLDPGMFNYYWSTASSNDCLISGPSGAGYAHLELWNAAHLGAFAGASDAPLQRAGLRTITVWDSVNPGIARAFATNCPTLLGLLDQGGAYNAVDLGLRTLALTPTYASTTNQVITAIASAASGWNGSAPVFIAAQAVTWSLSPSDLLAISRYFNTNEFQFVRPDHLFLLARQARGAPAAVTLPATGVSGTNAQPQGAVTGRSADAQAWLEWGTNLNYGAISGFTNVGDTLATVGAGLTGLAPGRIYHYRVVASNVLGMAWGADGQFCTGGRLEAWGGGASGVVATPPGLTNVVAIAAGASHALALRSDGTVVAWGSNLYGQTNVPPGLTNVVAVAAGAQHSLALTAAGNVVAWGGNLYGQTNVPAGMGRVIGISAGAYHNLAVTAGHAVIAWGDNVYGQTNVPLDLTNAVGVAGGYGHSLALRADGSLTAWGEDAFGQTNLPAGLGQVAAVAAGEYHSLALQADSNADPGPAPAADWVADSLAGTNGSVVSNWVDTVSGLGARQPAGASRPQLRLQTLHGHATVQFDGSQGQSLTVAAADSPMSGAGDFTLVVVFESTTPGAAATSFYNNTGLLGADVPGAADDWSLVINGGELGAGLGDGVGCNADLSLYGGNVTDGVPHLGAYVRSGGTVRLYVDGAIVAEQSGLCAAARVSCPFAIGAMTTAPDYFTGGIAEVRVYTQALNAPEMAALSASLARTYGLPGVAGAPVADWVADSLAGVNGSSVSNWPDALGAATAVQPVAANQPRWFANGINGHSTVRFGGGSGQYLTVPAADSPLAGAGSFTLLVVFQTSTPGSGSSSFFLNTGLLGAEQPGVVDDWAFCLNGSQLGAGLGAGGAGCGTDLSLYGGAVTDGRPHLGVYARNGDQVALYVDGVQVAAQDGLCADARLDVDFQVGAMTPASGFFTGDIAEIQVYDRALAPAELSAVAAGLAATYGLGGAAGAVVAWGDDASGQTRVPSGVVRPLSVASDGEGTFNLALQADGVVTGWGDDSQGQTSVPSTLTNVAAIAAGASFGLAIGNQAPLVGQVTASGFVNHDVVVPLTGRSFDGGSLEFYLQTLPAQGSLYQFAGSGRGQAIVSPGTPVADPGGRVVFAPPTGQSGDPLTSFDFYANDGAFNSAPAQAAVIIQLPAAPVFTGYARTTAGAGPPAFTLNFTGSSNATYSVWSSTNLVDWFSLGLAGEFPPGHYNFSDSSITNLAQNFYRLTAP